MGYQSKVQVIERGGIQRQFYLICPAPLAQALEMGEGRNHRVDCRRQMDLEGAAAGRESAQAKRGGAHGKR